MINDERRAALKNVNREVTELTDLICSKPREDLFNISVRGPEGKQTERRVDVLQRRVGDKVLLAMVRVMESEEGAPAHEDAPPVTVTVKPEGFSPAGPALRRGTGTRLRATPEGYRLTLDAWETAVLVLDAQ